MSDLQGAESEREGKTQRTLGLFQEACSKTNTMGSRKEVVIRWVSLSVCSGKSPRM